MTEPAPSKPTRARHILLVDDDTAFTDFFKEFLLTHRPGAWEVHAADHYVPALACLKEHPLNLIVLDVSMPIMDGVQLLRLLKQTHPELPVIILTSLATAEIRNQCLQNGAALFFDKTEVSDKLEKIYAALETVATAPREGFRGVLRQVGLPEVLQMECLGRKSSVLEVTAPGSSGRIFIEEGAIIHAESGSIQGEPALFHLLGLHGGEFQFKPFARPDRRTIDGHWESLVLESARLNDEASAVEAGQTEVQPAPAAPERPPSDAGRQVQEIVLCADGGQILYEWQSPEAGRRTHLIEHFIKMSGLFSKNLLLRRPDRLEVETWDGRVVVLLQPSRKAFVRTRNQTGTGEK